MCGLAGFQGLQIQDMSRALLVWGLGEGVDRRGGHAAGYTAVDVNGAVTVNRKLGRWGDRKAARFIHGAARHTAMLHARYATCAARTVNDAHPFTIKRDGKTVLWGMHNGVLYNAESSARRNKRPYTVDSREFFELLADNDLKGIAELQGYGVVTWIEAKDPNTVKLCRISDDGELVVGEIAGGGIAWASTEDILKGGLACTQQKVEKFYEIAPNKVHSVSEGSFWLNSSEPEIHLASRYASYGNAGPVFFSDWRPSRYDTARRQREREVSRKLGLATRSQLSIGDRLLEIEHERRIRDEMEESIVEREDKEDLARMYGLDPIEVDHLTYDEVYDVITELGLKVSHRLGCFVDRGSPRDDLALEPYEDEDQLPEEIEVRLVVDDDDDADEAVLDPELLGLEITLESAR